MTKLTPTQTDLLRAAAGAETDVIDAPTNTKAFSGLIKRGLMISVPRAEGGSHLLITDAGRAIIGAEVAEAPATLPSAPIAPPPINALPAPKGKIGVLVTLLRQAEGTTIGAMMQATGWQAHSVRGAMSGSVKKALGLTITSEKTDVGRLYRIVDGAAA